MEKEGSGFNQPMIPERPKRITRGSIRKLERMNTQEYRYSRGRIKDPDSGRTVKYSTYMKKKRSAAAKKGHRTRQKKSTPADGERITRLNDIMEEFMLSAGGKIPARQEYVDTIVEVRADVMRVYNTWDSVVGTAEQEEGGLAALSKALITHEADIANSVEVAIEDSDGDRVALHIEKIATAIRSVISAMKGYIGNFFDSLDMEEAALLQDQLE